MFFQSHILSLRAEWQKLKRSGIFWICFGASVFIPLLITVVSFIVKATERSKIESRWDSFIESNFGAFTSFFFPVFLVLMVVRLVNLEHKSDTWKLMETQPISRAALYISKWEVALALSFICLLMLLLFTLAGGFLLQIFKPAYKLHEHSINWSKTFSALLRFWISGLGIISIQYWLALMIRSFAWPMIIGLMATIAGSIFTGFEVVSWWPYSAPARTSATYIGSVNGGWLLFHEKLSILTSIFFLIVGYRYFLGKSFQRAYFRNAKVVVASLAALVVFITLFTYINSPIQLGQHHRTVINGTIESKTPVPQIALLRQPLGDTVALINVKEGKFHSVVEQDLATGMYFIRAGKIRRNIYLGNKDSLFIEMAVDEKTEKFAVRGNRAAENEFLMKGVNNNASWALTNYAYNYKPEEYAAICLSDWRDAIKAVRSFKTSDNVRPANDFLTVQEKMVSVNYAVLLDHYYPDIFRVYHPNEVLKYPSSVEKIRQKFTLEEKDLLSFTEYRNYVIDKYETVAGRDKSKLVAAVAATRDPFVRSFLAFDLMQNEILPLRDSVLRKNLIVQSISLISDATMQNILVRKIEQLKNLRPHSPAPPFKAEAINAASFDLAALSGRYLVVDVWATWCGPCKREAPFFEQLAEQYTSEYVAFVGISVDEDIHAWKSQVSGNSSKVLHLWAKNAEADFKDNYAVSSIPRYILISPKGTIINADMPPPSDPQFEVILQRELASFGNNAL